MPTDRSEDELSTVLAGDKASRELLEPVVRQVLATWPDFGDQCETLVNLLVALFRAGYSITSLQDMLAEIEAELDADDDD